MENLHTCSLTESDLIPQRDTEGVELFEDASSNADWIDMYSDIDSHTTCGLLEDYNRPTELLDDLYEKNKMLERKWENAEKKYQNLLQENLKQNLNLSNEKERANRYQKKLQYIQSNCVLLNRLKENYLDCMCNQAQKISKMESQECSAQTEAFVNDSQRNDEKFQKFEKFCSFAKNENIVAVKRSELQLMKATLEQLKVMVDQKSSRNDQDEHKIELHRLQNTIAILNDTIAKKNYEIYSLKLLVSDGKKMESIDKENTAMKRIITKLEKRHREVEKLCKPFRSIPVLTEDEKTIVQSIFKRCGLRQVKKCSRSLSCDAASRKITPNKREIYSSQLSNRNYNPFITVTCKEDMLYFNIPNNHNKTKYTRMEVAEKPFTPKSQFVKTLS